MSVPVRNDDKPIFSSTPRIGLALGGGGARGLTHVVIFEVLDEFGVKPSIISGTSIGALLGAAYAAGLGGVQIRELVEEALTNRFGLVRQLIGARAPSVTKLLRVLPWRSALLDPEALLDVILPTVIPRKFEALDTPLRVIATDLASHDTIVFSRGDLRQAIAASIAIPVLFSPVEVDGRMLVDGGLTNPLPLDQVRDEIDILIGIDVSGNGRDEIGGPQPSVTTMLVQSVQILQKTIIRERLLHTQPDIYVDADIGRVMALDFHKVREILAAAEATRDVFRRKLERVLKHQSSLIVEEN